MPLASAASKGKINFAGVRGLARVNLLIRKLNKTKKSYKTTKCQYKNKKWNKILKTKKARVK